MRIAYCFSGHIRMGAKNPTLLERLIGPNPGDIFVHTYPYLNTSGPLWHGDHWGQKTESWHDIAEICDTYPVTAMMVDKLRGGDEHAPEAFKRACPGRWSVAQSHALRMKHQKETGKKYDLVFNARFDLWLGERMFLVKPDPVTLYGSHLKHEMADGDVFTYGSELVMNVLCLDAFPANLESVAMECGQEGEQVTTALRKLSGFDYEVHKIKHGLMRSNGIMMIG